MSGEVLRLPRERVAAVAAAWIAFSGASHADNGIHGRIELQDAGAFARDDSLDAQLGAEDRNDLLASLRFTWEPSWSRWSLAFHYVVNVDYGDEVPLKRAEASLLPAPPSTWFNLTETFED